MAGKFNSSFGSGCAMKIKNAMPNNDAESIADKQASPSKVCKQVSEHTTAIRPPKFVVKNTFVEVADEPVFEDRRRIRTAPEMPAMDDIDSDSDSDLENPKDKHISCSSPKMPTVTTRGHESVLSSSPKAWPSHDQSLLNVSCSSPKDSALAFSAPKVIVKNTFIDIQEGIEKEDRRRVRTAPGGAGIFEGIESDTEDEVGGSSPKKHASVASDVVQNASSHSIVSEQTPDSTMRGFVWELSRTPDGSRAVQNALESATSSEERCDLAFELKGHIWDAAHDLHANYVLQKIIMLMQTRSLQFIVDEITYSKGTASVASRNKYACRVIQRLFEFCSTSQIADIVEDVFSNLIMICCDKYGKYVVQCLLDHGTILQIRQLVDYFAENVRELATDPHGCSVLGKAMSVARREDQAYLAEAISNVPGLLKGISASVQGQFLARAVQAMKNNGTDVESQVLGEKLLANTPQDNSTGAKSSRKKNKIRRGCGGGALAQQEAEARDLLESLRAACARRSRGKISKALDRVQIAFTTPWAHPALHMEAIQSCQHARNLLWGIVN